MIAPDTYFWTRLIVRVAVEAACVVGIAMLMDRLVRPAFWRRALWQAAVVCLLLLTASEMSGFGRGVASYLFSHAPPQYKPAVWTRPVESAPLPVPMTFTPTVIAPAPVTFPIAVVKPEIPRAVWWPGLLWLAGAFAVLVRVAAAQILFISLRRRRSDFAKNDLSNRAAAILRRLAVRHKIRLLQSPGLTGPIAFGILRPTVGLPVDFAVKFAPAEQDAMLAHELAHLAARDPLWYLLADAGSAALWWHPQAWWARRSLHRASEFAADEAAALFPEGPAALAGCLVTLGRQMTKFPAASRMGIEGGGFRSNLAERVQRLLRLADAARHPSYGWRSRAAKIASIIAASAAAIALSGCLQSRDAEKPPTLQASLSQSWAASPAATVWHSALPPKKAPPQVRIEVRFAGVAQRNPNPLGLNSYLCDMADATPVTNMVAGAIILTQPQLKNLINVFATPGSPRDQMAVAGPLTFTIPTGRQAHIPMYGNVVFRKPSTNLANLSRNRNAREAYRPNVDLIPTVCADGSTIQLIAMPDLTFPIDFDSPALSNPDGSQVTFARLKPWVATTKIRDGETLMLGGVVPATARDIQQDVMVFVTVRLVDASGSPVHSDAELNGANDASTRPTQDNSPVTALVNDGKLLYQRGKLDEAEAKLMQALELDPSNTAAAYHLDLLKEARYLTEALDPELETRMQFTRQWLIPADPVTNAQTTSNTMTKLREIKLSALRDNLEHGLPLSEVLELLNKFSISNGVAKLGVQFSFNPLGGGTVAGAKVAGYFDPGAITIKFNPPLKNVTLLEDMDQICMGADMPIGYSVDGRQVWFFAKLPDAASLQPVEPEPWLIETAQPPSPPVAHPYSRVEPTSQTATGREVITRKLWEIKLSQMPGTFGEDLERGLPLSDVLRSLKRISITNDTQKVGINFLYNPHGGGTAAEGGGVDADKIWIKFRPPLESVTLLQLLDAFCLVADHPISYAVEDYGVVFFVKPPEPVSRAIAGFHVEPTSFMSIMRHLFPKAADPQPNILLNRYFETVGIDITNNGSFFLFNPRTGDIMARGTTRNLDWMEQAIDVLNTNPPLDSLDRAKQLINKSRTNGFFFLHQTPEKAWLETEEFVQIIHVDSNTFLQGMRDAFPQIPARQANSSNAIPEGHRYNSQDKEDFLDSDWLRRCFASLGINFTNYGIHVSFNMGRSDVQMQGTFANYDVTAVFSVMELLNKQPPQMRIDVTIATLSEKDGNGLNSGLNMGNFTADNLSNATGIAPAPSPHRTTNFSNPTGVFPGQGPVGSNPGQIGPSASDTIAPGAPARVTALATNATITGILTDSQFRLTTNAISHRAGAELLPPARVTTKSGGPTAIGSDRLVAPDTNAATNVSRSSGNGTNALYERLGVNVIPTISADGYTIEITASPTYAQYVGHEKAGLVIPQAAIIPIATPGNEAAVPLQAAPAFSAPSFPVNVWDGQTIMLSGPKPESPLSQKLHSPRETIFVFITARIVDPAGNPVHTDAELKATENSIPPQPASPPSIAPK